MRMARQSFQTETEISDKTSAKSLKLEIKQEERLNKLNKQLKGQAFSKIKYNNTIFCLGDAVEIKDPTSNNTSIAIIKKIFPSNQLSKHKFWPMIEVEWLFTKQDVISFNCLNSASFVGSFEVFRSNATELIFIESIQRKAQLLTLDEYQTLEVVNEGVYFTRARIDIHKVSSNNNYHFIIYSRKRYTLALLHGKTTVCVSSPIIPIKFTSNV